MWNIEVVRTYKAVGVYECEDKVIFEVNSLDEASEIVSMFDKYSIGEYRYSINRKKESEIVSMFDKYSIGEYRYSINRKKESEEE